jgi:hypothetical protein
MPFHFCPRHRASKATWDPDKGVIVFECTECDWKTYIADTETDPGVKDDPAPQPPTWRQRPPQL